MKISTRKADSLADLNKHLPKRYIGREKIRGSGPYFLAIVGGKVAQTSTISKCIEQTPIGYQLIVAVNNLTLDAADLLTNNGAQAITLSDFPWTDQTRENIKVLIGAKVKKPN